jgi:hypothetical protein
VTRRRAPQAHQGMVRLLPAGATGILRDPPVRELLALRREFSLVQVPRARTILYSANEIC